MHDVQLGLLLRFFYSLPVYPRIIADIRKQHDLRMDEITAHAGYLTSARCTFDGTGIFDFDDDGDESLVFEVFGEDDEHTIDLCAASISEPRKFGTALGVAAILGAARVTNPATWWCDALLHVHRHPLDWLKSGCKGVVILDHRLAPLVLSQALGPMVAEDAEHARDLKIMLCQPAVSPANILVPRSKQRMAA